MGSVTPVPYERRLPDGARVLIDSNPLIYLLESNPLAAAFRGVFRDVEAGRLIAVVTPITLAETLAGPIAAGNDVMTSRYRAFLCENHRYEFHPVDAALAETAARVRVSERLKLPDAVQLAAALAHRCDALITHDRGFRHVQGLAVLGLDADAWLVDP